MTTPAIDSFLDEVIEKLHETEKSANEDLDENFEFLMDTVFLPEIKATARAANLPDGFVEGLDYVKTGFARGKIINTWGDSKKPLAKWFNFGTVDHYIKPKNPDGVLAFPAVPESKQRNASAIFYKDSREKGDTIFSKGHYVSGLPRTEAMEIGIKHGLQRMKQIQKIGAGQV